MDENEVLRLQVADLKVNKRIILTDSVRVVVPTKEELEAKQLSDSDDEELG